MVHLDELVEVDREHFKGDHQMLSKHELVPPPDNVFLVFWILVIQVFDKPGFNKSLFVKSLFVFQDFQGYILALFMIIALEDDTKRSFSKLLCDLISIAQMFINPRNVLVALGVKAIICGLIEDAHLGLGSGAAGVLPIQFLFLPLFNWEEVDGFVFENLPLLDFPQVGTQDLEGVICRHWESVVVIGSRGRVLLMPHR